MFDRADTLYKRLFTDERVEFVDLATIVAAFIGFAVHLVFIALARVWENAPPFIAIADGSFLTAIYTPFSFILFYEVFALVLSIPRSFTGSVGIQLEIIALIIIRRIFGDIGHLTGLENLTLYNEWVRLLGYDMLAAVGMFFGVILFSRVSDYVPESDEFRDVQSFVKIKRAVTLVLFGVLVVLAVYTLIAYIVAALTAIEQGVSIPENRNVVFYREMFTVMVFADVAILLFSLAYSHRFELVFRNAGFVIATILLRLALTIPRPLDLLFITAAFVFVNAVLFGYGYYLHSGVRQTVQEDEEPDIV